MCTFNGSRYLSAQLESIAAQVRVPDELIICDDKSSDGCEEIAQQFSRRAPFPVRLFVNDTTLGSTRNFEKAISLSKGPIVALADQDDVWYPQKLRQFENSFLNSSQTVAVFSDADLIDENSAQLGVRLWKSLSFNAHEQQGFSNGQAFRMLVRRPIVTGATMAFRKDCLDLRSPMPPNSVHDRWLAFLLTLRGGWQLIPEPLMQYRRHGAQQFGPGYITFRDRIAHFLKVGPSFYREEVEIFSHLREWLTKYGENLQSSKPALSLVERKISHLQRRIDLRRMHFGRISAISGELLNGGYRHYSAGWKSAAKDLFAFPGN
jgi:glycosyltransferase involved in cell wall biosynthesis